MFSKLALRHCPISKHWLGRLPSFFRVSSNASLALSWKSALARSRTLLYYSDSLLFHLFIATAGCSKGQAVSSQSISKWAVQGISLHYCLATVTFPLNINLALWLFKWHLPPASEEGPISEICQVMTWGNPLTFIRHSVQDVTTSAHYSFGKAVL